jgi:hypothetical protein
MYQMFENSIHLVAAALGDIPGLFVNSVVLFWCQDNYLCITGLAKIFSEEVTTWLSPTYRGHHVSFTTFDLRPVLGKRIAWANEIPAVSHSQVILAVAGCPSRPSQCGGIRLSLTTESMRRYTAVPHDRVNVAVTAEITWHLCQEFYHQVVTMVGVKLVWWFERS